MKILPGISEQHSFKTDSSAPHYQKVLFASCPTGAYCREDRCQSYFEFELIPSMRPPMEDCESAASIKELNSSHLIVDAPAEKLNDLEFLRLLIKENPDLIILAVTFGSLEADLKWAHTIKTKLNDCRLGLRGAPSYVWADEILKKNQYVDFCVYGDYEIVFQEILTKDYINANGVIYRTKNGDIIRNQAVFAKDLDSLPLPDRSGIKQNLYTVRGSKKTQATIHVQRGCPFPCTFCLVHTVSSNKARHRSPAHIALEIKNLIDQGINYFYLRAETFTLDKKWAIEVSEELRRTCPEAKWVTATRVECVDEEVIPAMYKGGCYGISFGVDVASEKIGKLVKKMPAREKAYNAMRLCDKYGIISLAYLMIGFIWDDQETLAETKEFANYIRPDLLTIHFAHPYPGTPYYEAVKAEGYKTISPFAQSQPALNPQKISSTQLKSFSRNLLLNHYLRPAVIYSLIRKRIKSMLSI